MLSYAEYFQITVGENHLLVTA